MDVCSALNSVDYGARSSAVVVICRVARMFSYKVLDRIIFPFFLFGFDRGTSSTMKTTFDMLYSLTGNLCIIICLIGVGPYARNNKFLYFSAEMLVLRVTYGVVHVQRLFNRNLRHLLSSLVKIFYI